MKKLLLLLALMSCVLSSVEAQSISGKWKAKYEFPEDVILLYPKVSCKYTFKDDGTFVLKLKGKKRITGKNAPFISFANRTTRVKVKGTYKVENGRISTFINPKDTKSHIYSEEDTPDEPNLAANEYSLRRQEMRNQLYNQGEAVADVLAATVKEELNEFWHWNNLPLIITSDNVMIGNKVKLYR